MIGSSNGIINTRYGFYRKFKYGWKCIFDAISSFIASKIPYISIKAIDIGKQVVTKLGQKAGEKVGKTVSNKLNPNTKRILNKYITPLNQSQNFNNLVEDSGNNQQKAIAIQDLVKNINGSGIKKI